MFLPPEIIVAILLFALSAWLWRTAPEARPAVVEDAVPAPAVQATIMTAETQLAKLARIVDDASSHAVSAERLHRAASLQVDAAHYALQNLLADLSAVMAISAPSHPTAVSAELAMPKRLTLRPAYETALAA